MNDKVSIIIPVYNSEAYLERCIDSVIAQSYTWFEIILVNDGSTDDSGNMCDRYSEKDRRIVVVHKKNGGVSSARNIGLSAATGKYVVFIDSDDYVSGRFIEGLIDTKNMFEASLIIAPVKTTGNETNYTTFRSGKLELTGDNQAVIIDLFKSILIYGPFCKLYLKEIILRNHIVFDENMSFGEDLFFNLTYLSHINSIAFGETSPYFYCIENMHSLSRSKIINSFEREKNISKRIKEYLNSIEIDEALINKLISDRLFYNAYIDIYTISGVNCKNNQKKKLIKKILGDPVLKKIMTYSEITRGYSPIVIFMMKYSFWRPLVYVLKRI